MNHTRIWNIDDHRFPEEGSVSEKLAFLVSYAVLAPSSHNTQPWRFRTRPSHLELQIDRSRRLPVVDPDGRQLVMSCGAALFHVRTALRHFGFLGDIETIRPPGAYDPFDGLRSIPDVLARVGLGRKGRPSTAEEQLFQAIPLRHTNRSRFARATFPDAVLTALARAAEREGAWLHHVVNDRDRQTLAELVARADRLQFADAAFRAELAAWMRPNHPRATDGVPGYAFGFGELKSYLSPFVLRTFDVGEGRAAHDQDLVEGSPLLMVLGTREDHPEAWLRAGQALDRVLLRATAAGLAASFLSQPVEVSSIRSQLSKLIARDGFPQVVLRLGVGPEVHPTPRRPLSEVLDRAGTDAP